MPHAPLSVRLLGSGPASLRSPATNERRVFVTRVGGRSRARVGARTACFASELSIVGPPRGRAAPSSQLFRRAMSQYIVLTKLRNWSNLSDHELSEPLHFDCNSLTSKRIFHWELPSVAR